MFCKHCGVEIEGAARNCPLCQKPLDEMQIFPDVKSTKRLKKVTFTLIYAICALVAGIVCVLINLLLPSRVLWSVAVLGVLLYVYILVAGTIFSKKHTASKIFLQTIAVALLTVFLQNLTPTIEWAANFAVPLVLFIGALALGVISVVFKRAGTYVFCCFLIAITGLIPVTYVLIRHEPVVWPSLVCAAGCATILVVIGLWGLFSGKSVLHAEIKRKFHI